MNSLQVQQRQLEGALVSFGPGAEVFNIDFPHLKATVSQPPAPAGVPPPVYTMMCTWFHSSAVVYLHYKKYGLAVLAHQRLQIKLHGRQLDCTILPPPQCPGFHTALWALEVGNISSITTVHDIRAEVCDIPPENILFSRASHVTKIPQRWAVKFTSQTFLRAGYPLESIDIVPSNSSMLLRALARCKTPVDTTVVPYLSGKYFPQLRSRFFLEQVVTFTIPTLEEITFGLRDQIRAACWASSKAIYSWIQHVDQGRAAIRISGANVSAVADLKVNIERLLVGRVILATARGKALWNDFFFSDPGLAYLNSLCQSRLLFVRRDLRTRQLIMYGPDSLYERTRAAIHEALLRHDRSFHYLTLGEDLLKKTLAGGFGRVVGAIGKEKVKLVRAQPTPYIQVHGHPRDMDTVRDILSRGSGQETSRPSSPECPACLTEPEDPVQLSCGHHYCRHCFVGQCKAVTLFGTPVVCLGESGKCNQVVSLAEIRTHLSSPGSDDDDNAAMEALLLQSLRLFVRSHPGQVRYCPTPDCPTIVPVTRNGVVVVCSGCQAAICTTCQNVAHDGLTCEAMGVIRVSTTR